MADAASGDAGTYENVMDASIAIPDASYGAEQPPTPVDDAGKPIVSRDAGSSLPIPMSDAGSINAADASSPVADASPDAGATPVRTCAAGQELGGHCWFLGEINQSCNSVCAAHGGFEPTPTWIGSRAQGGSLRACAALLTLLQGSDATTTAGTRADGRGVGCHLFEAQRWWLYDPDFNPDAYYWAARIVCSCVDQ